MFSRRLVDQEVVYWQMDGFAWLIDNFEDRAGLGDTELWLPIPDHYPEVGDKPLPEHIFGLVKRQCRFDENDIFELKAEKGRPDPSLGGVAMVQTEGQTACGTYQCIPMPSGRPREIIRYDEELAQNPTQLVATFAHELSHALHARAAEPLEEPPELYELFTDLTAVFMGFGVFLANTRFEISQFSDFDVQGWQAGGAGYLPEADLVFATALFMSIKRIPENTASPHLKPRLQKMLSKAFRQLSKLDNDISKLRIRLPPDRGQAYGLTQN